MPHYRCIVAGEGGKKSDVVREASNEKELVASFSGSGTFLVSYTEVDETDLYKSKKQFDRDTILEFTEIMAALLNSGLTVQDALELCTSIAAKTETGILCQGLLQGVKRGMPFHQVLKVYTPSFSLLYQSLVRLGEKTGSVSLVFDRMCSYLRSEKKTQRKLGNALIYPIFILCIALAGCLGIIFYIMPRMAEIFSAFNTISEVDINAEIGRIYHSIWIMTIVFGMMIAAFFIIRLLRRTSEGFALRFDRFILTIPYVGTFIRSIQTLDFSFAMEMLTAAGITVGNALKESSSVVSNKAFGRAVLEVHQRLLRGERLSAAFMDFEEFPEYVGTWIAVGERTGSVELVFSQIRDYFQRDVDHGSEKIMGMIEPALIFIIGCILCILVIQFVVPIFSLYGKML